MNFKNKKLVNKFKDFVSSITKKDRVAVIHHTDPDGVCSGVIASKLIERIRNKKIDLRINQKGNIHYITNHTLKELKRKKINKVIITDLVVDETPEGVKKLSKFADVLIIDHHPVYKSLKRKNITLIKSSLVSNIPPVRYCAAKLTYDLGNILIDLSDLDWIAASGSIGDIAVAPFKSWLNTVFKKYKIKTNKDLFKTPLGKVAILISSAESFDNKNVKLCYDVVYKAKSYKDVLNSRLKKFRKKIDKELQYYIKNLKRFAEIYPKLNLIIYEINPEYNTKSPLCTLLGIKYPHKTILTVSKKKDKVAISARRGDSNVSVNKLLENAVKGMPHANAGGHVPSAGAVVPKKYYKKFKKRIINILEKKVIL
jgi:single-stranded DNA-specific DHH superfamily exonuclease